MAVSLDKFLGNLRESGLFPREELDALLAEIPAPQKADGEQLARELVRRRKLTAYQAQEVYAGRGKKLVLGNYLIKDKLGQGGMGMVLKAEHRRMGRLVALKVMSAAALANPDAVKRFQREVQAAARLSHPNIVTAYDADEEGGTHFLVMEFVEGSDLASLVRDQGRLPAEKALHCILQAARGLEFAHSKGVIHRDIKPANLLLDGSGTVKVLDMGLARIEHDAAMAELTRSDEIMGTVDYMAPEQAANTRGADARADIYSLGMTLWFLLTGRIAFEGETMMAKLLAHQEQGIPSLMEHCRTATPALEELFERMVAKRPADRFQTMTQVIAALERCRAASNLSDAAPSLAAAPDEDSKLGVFLRRISAGPAGTKAGTTAANDPRYQATIVTGPALDDTGPATPPLASPSPLPKPAAPPKFEWWKSWPVLAGAGLGGVVLIGLAVWAIARTGGPPNPPPGPVGVTPRDKGKPPTIAAALVPRFTNDLGMKFVLVPKGKTWLGGGGDKPGTREVAFDYDFYLGQYEVTQEQWLKVNPKWNPSHFSRAGNGRSQVQALPDAEVAQLPVESVSWDDCQKFLTALNAQVKEPGWVYRLPTEDEWEYACRGGPMESSAESAFDYYFETPSNRLLPTDANYNYTGCKLRPVKVGSYPPNKLGLCDMHGNVWEYCHETVARENDTVCFSRGSGWNNLAHGHHRAANHYARPLAKRDTDHGLRLARVPAAQASPASKPPAVAPLAAARFEFVIRPDITWAEAKAEAERMGGHLAVITSREENEQVLALVKPILVDGQHAWLGASRDQPGGEWKWVTGEPFAFSGWFGGEPNEGGTGPWAVAFRVRADNSLGWNDAVAATRYKTRGFILERELSPYDILTSPDWEWTKPVNLGPIVNSPATDSSPCLSADGLSLLFDSSRPSGLGKSDLWMCRRQTLEASWGAPANLGDVINSPDSETHPCLASDGLSLVFSSDRGPSNPRRLWMATRKSAADPWSPPTPISETIASGAKDYRPWLSADGFTLLFHSYPRGPGREDLWECTRKSTAEPWGAPRNLGPVVNGPARDHDPCLSSDGRVLLFASSRTDERHVDLWQATRASRDAPWSEPVALGSAVNTPNEEACPSLSADGRTLIFRSWRSGGLGEADLWMTTRVPKPRGVAPSPGAPLLAIAPFSSAQARASQEAWASHLGTTVEIASVTGMRLVLIPPGQFQMGSSAEQIDQALRDAAALQVGELGQSFIRSREPPQRHVTLSRPIRLGRTEVTVGQFRQFVEATAYVTEAEKSGLGDSWTTGPDAKGRAGATWRAPGDNVVLTDNFPVTQITWRDAVAFCQWLSQRDSLTPAYRQAAGGSWELVAGANGYRLPTEAEWEYACRAGTTTQFSFGDDYARLAEYGWFAVPANRRPQPVGGLKPNPFGLYDMHGNVYEWCQDWAPKDANPVGPLVDPPGPATGTIKVLRSGSFKYDELACRSAARGTSYPAHRYHINGFRVARTLSSELGKAASVSLPGDSPYDILTSPDWKWSEPENLGPLVNSSVDDSGPSLSADGLTLLFDSMRGPSHGGHDLWMTRRASLDASWSQPENLGPAVNSVAGERAPGFSSDGLTLVFSRDVGTAGKFDFRVCTRSRKDEPWGKAADLWPLLASPVDDYQPTLSADGLLLWFHSNRPGGQGGRDFWLARRASATEPFGTPENIGPPVNGKGDEFDPCVSSDGRVLLFVRNVDNQGDLFMSARASPTSAWSDPAPIGPPLSTAAAEGGPTLSADGRTLVFHARRVPGQGGWDLWISHRVPAKP